VDDSAIELDESFRVTANMNGSPIATSVVTIKSNDVTDTTGDLVAFWSFDLNIASLTHDIAPFGSVADHGLFVGAAEVIDNMLQLSGNGGVEVKSSADINTGIVGSRTLALSFYANDTDTRQVVFEEGGERRGMNIYVENGEVVLGGWNADASQSGWQGTWLKAPIDAGRWYDVAIVLDAGQAVQPGAMIGYLNGLEIGRGEASQIWGRNDPIGIGVGRGQTRFESVPQTKLNAKGLDGGIENVRIYNRVLPSDAIAALAVKHPDPPLTVVEVSVSDAMAIEGDDLVVDVTLDRPSWLATTVQFTFGDVSTQPSDYELPAVLQITISPGSVAAQLRIKTVDDLNPESPERFQLVPKLVSGSATIMGNGSGTILDNDEVDLGESAVASWTFNELIDGKVPDVAASGSLADNGAVLAGAAIEPGWGMNGAISFDGISRVAIPSSVDINLSAVTHRTVSLWFYADETTSRQVIFEEGASTTGLALYIEAGKLIGGAWSQFAVAGGWKGVWLDVAIQPNQWNHVAVVLDSTNESFSGYLNGLEFGRAIGKSLVSHTDPIGIGATNGGARFQTGAVFTSGTSLFSGYIDEVYVYNSPLFPNQILSIASRADQFVVAAPPIALAASFHSGTSKTDLNKDGATTAADALLVINLLTLNSTIPNSEYDANDDGIVSAADALEVIYAMNRNEVFRGAMAFSSTQQPLESEIRSLTEEWELERRDRAIEELTNAASSKLF
jgi:Concanavalin A-like lectin/glucanases superfamily/Dockerin type I domain